MEKRESLEKATQSSPSQRLFEVFLKKFVVEFFLRQILRLTESLLKKVSYTMKLSPRK